MKGQKHADVSRMSQITKSLQSCRHGQTTSSTQRLLPFLTGHLLWRSRKRTTMENMKSWLSHRLLYLLVSVSPLLLVLILSLWYCNISNIYLIRRRRLWGPVKRPESSGHLRLPRRWAGDLVFHSSVHISPRPDAKILFSALRGWRRDLLQPRWNHHRHRDDWRGLVEGAVPRAGRPLPPSLRSAAVVRTMEPSLPKTVVIVITVL